MKFNKIITSLSRIFLIVSLLCMLSSLSACNTPDSEVEGSYNNPYTKAEIEKMLQYHGALVAKFDKGQWYFLSGHRWIKIENGGAKRFALASHVSSDKSPL